MGDSRYSMGVICAVDMAFMSTSKNKPTLSCEAATKSSVSLVVGPSYDFVLRLTSYGHERPHEQP